MPARLKSIPRVQAPLQDSDDDTYILDPKLHLVIHKIVLVNFKSYAGRQEIRPPFHNGKLSELIHNSARYPDLDECSMEVHFSEIIDLRPSPIAPGTHSAHGRPPTEIQTLHQGCGIDLTHFLSLQEEAYTSEHDDGLLEYPEDIIGTAALKAPIQSVLAWMDQLGEERAETVARLRIVEKEKAQLDAERLWVLDFFPSSLRRLCMGQEDLEKELEDEMERNKDDIRHLGLLKKHYKERNKAYVS
ncbi:hypothetical protein F4604DRAFT_1683729 [Suillus subluteus]|nr:hypothetical protein F4604DRAFT_1683729 [Suillus subluteus]